MASERKLAPSAGATEPGGVEVRDVLATLKRRKAWVIGVPLTFLTLASAYTLTAHPAYTATAQIYVDPRDRALPKDDPLTNSVPGDGLLLVESQLKIATSGEVLKRAIDKTGLTKDTEFNGDRAGLMGTLKRMLSSRGPDDIALTTLRNLRLNAQAKRLDRSFVIEISASADTGERAARIANALVEAYFEERAAAGASFNRRTFEAINTRLDSLRQAVRDSEERVAEFKAQNKLIGARNKLVTEQQMDEATTQLTTAQTTLANAQARAKLVATLLQGGLSLDAAPEAVQSPTIVQLRAQAAAISRQESLLAQQDGPAHPDLKAIMAQERAIKASINTELERIGRVARNEASQAQTNVQALKANLDHLKSAFELDEKAMVPLRELERKADTNRGIYESFLAKAKVAEQQEVLDNSNVRLISLATTPEQKSWPPTALMLASAGFAGLAFGVAIALGIDELDRKKHAPRHPPSPDPPNLAPRSPVERFAPGPSNSNRRPRLEALTNKLLRAPLGYTVMLSQTEAPTSLAHTALDLAAAVIRGGKQVLLIDADFSRAAVTKRLSLQNYPGLTDVLARQTSLDEVARAYDNSGILIAPVGRLKASSPGLLTQSQAARVIAAAREFECVIVSGGVMDVRQAEFGLIDFVDEVIVMGTPGPEVEDDVRDIVATLLRCKIRANEMIIDGAAA